MSLVAAGFPCFLALQSLYITLTSVSQTFIYFDLQSGKGKCDSESIPLRPELSVSEICHHRFQHIPLPTRTRIVALGTSRQTTTLNSPFQPHLSPVTALSSIGGWPTGSSRHDADGTWNVMFSGQLPYVRWL